MQLELLVSNLSPNIRREVRDGRKYLVADATLIVPGVLNGSRGRLYYPPDEVSKNPAQWDKTPMVVYHPQVNGVHVSARTPGVIENSGIGFIERNRYEDKHKSELWFDEEYTSNYDRKLKPEHKIVPRLLAGKPIELSTGLYTDNIPKRGVSHDGREYDAEARNYRPDHLAILPDQVGACSNKDGCGVNVNSDSERNEEGQFAPTSSGTAKEEKDKKKKDAAKAGSAEAAQRIADYQVKIENSDNPLLLTRIVSAVTNAFCATGEGGGQDNSCSPEEARGAMKEAKAEREASRAKLDAAKAAYEKELESHREVHEKTGEKHEAGRQSLVEKHQEAKDKAEHASGQIDERMKEALDAHDNGISSTSDSPDPAHVAFDTKRGELEDAIHKVYYDQNDATHPKERVSATADAHRLATELHKMAGELKPGGEGSMSAKDIKEAKDALKTVISSTKAANKWAKEHLDQRRAARDIRRIARNSSIAYAEFVDGVITGNLRLDDLIDCQDECDNDPDCIDDCLDELANNVTGVYGNPQSMETGKFKPLGSGYGKGEVHESAQRGNMVWSERDRELGAQDPSVWAMDDETLVKARAAASKGYDDTDESYGTVVAHIYQKMSGEVKGMEINEHYPWDQCIQDQKDKGEDEESADKICGSIKAANNMAETTNAFASDEQRRAFFGNLEDGDVEAHTDDANIKSIDAHMAESNHGAGSYKADEAHYQAATAHDKAAKQHDKTGNNSIAEYHRGRAEEHWNKTEVINPARLKNNQENTVAAPTRNQIIQHLTTNCDCWKGAKDVLNSFTDERLKKLLAADIEKRKADIAVNAVAKSGFTVNVEGTLVKNAGCSAEEEASEGEEGEDTTTDETQANVPNTYRVRVTPKGKKKEAPMMNQNLTPEQIENLETAARITQNAKRDIIRRLVANVKDEAKQKRLVANLQKKKLDELEDLLELQGPTQNAQHEDHEDTQWFFGAAGGAPVHNRRFTEDDAAQADQDASDMMPATLNYEEMVTENRRTAV